MLIKASIIDKISDSFLKEISTTIPTKDILISLVIAMLSAIIINYVYKKTYIGVSYAKSFSLSIILLTLVTSIVIRTINSNLALSLGMVGALSIVRFRTAVKDPVDTIFMFWAITVGIMSGAGLYIVTLLATLLIGLFYFISYTYQVKKTRKVLLIVKASNYCAEKISELLKDNKKCILRTESYKDNVAELTYEVGDRKEIESILRFKNEEGIITINVIDID